MLTIRLVSRTPFVRYADPGGFAHSRHGSGLMGWSRSWLLAAVVLAAVLVMPWQQQRLVASQGLNVPAATLGAGSVATATEFEVGQLQENAAQPWL
jgi:hypothetical protein